MPYGFVVAAFPVSGSDITVASRQFNGIGPCRLYLKNSGSNALDACDVKIGPTLSALTSLDDSTFASLGAGEMASLHIDGPVDALAVVAASSDTTLDIWLSDSGLISG